MTPWLPAALDYLESWIAFQRELHDQPGCALAIAVDGTIVREFAFGLADLSTGEALTPRHGFRLASHSKCFTAAGILRLVEAGRLRLDDPVGRHVECLHPQIAEASLAQLLSHSAGLVRDGPDGGHFTDRCPFPTKSELLADLALPPVYPAAQRFKYSNHGFALLGLVIEAVTGEPYADWILREVLRPFGLAETQPDITRWRGPAARGHSGRLPLGRRVVIPADNPANAMASATGFVATAADLARFIARLSPAAEASPLSALTRREMTRQHWHDAQSSLGRYYGLGIMSGGEEDWAWHGHSGGFQGIWTRVSNLPALGLTVSVMINAIDGPVHPWHGGVLQILRSFARYGAPSPRTESWRSRLWTIWGASDLVPVDGKVLVANPALSNPFLDAWEIEIEAADRGRIARAPGFTSPGEPVRLERGASGEIEAAWLAGAYVVSREALRAEMRERYDAPSPHIMQLREAAPERRDLADQRLDGASAG
jgi:D-alanyl-D-alanine carboxypeptidase